MQPDVINPEPLIVGIDDIWIDEVLVGSISVLAADQHKAADRRVLCVS